MANEIYLRLQQPKKSPEHSYKNQPKFGIGVT